MNDDTPSLEKLLSYKSSRHHYIPRFLINGFTNPDGLLYIYDKQNDKILDRPRPSKSIFFEVDRNTVEIKNGLTSSIIEDVFYGDIDNRISKIIRYYQTEPLTNIDFKINDVTEMLVFLISLFWRIPKTDFTSEDLINQSKISGGEIDPEVLRNDPTFRKITRAGLLKHHIDELLKFGLEGRKYFNIHQNANPIYVIGDFPFLSKVQTNEFRKFDDTDILFAISSRRIYSSTKENLRNFPAINSYGYNAAIINQSIKYIACEDLIVLEQSINFYKELKRRGLLDFSEYVFKIE